MPPCLCACSVSILRTHFQVPYPATPLFATLTKTAGACTQNSRFGNAHLTVHCRRLWSQREKKRAQHPDKVGTGAAPYKEAMKSGFNLVGSGVPGDGGFAE